MPFFSLKNRWNSAMTALVLIRIGQELGTDSRLARLVHDAIEVAMTLAHDILG